MNGSEYTGKPLKYFDFFLSKFDNLHVRSLAKPPVSFMNVVVES